MIPLSSFFFSLPFTSQLLPPPPFFFELPTIQHCDMLLSGRADLSDEAPIFPSHVFSNFTLQKLSTLHTTSLNFRRLSSHFLFVAIQHLKHLC